VSTWGAFLEEEYAPWVKANRKSGGATVKRLKSCFAWLEDRQMADIDSRVIEKWRMERAERGKQPITINRDVVTLKSALSRAVAWKIVDTHPLQDLSPLAVGHCDRVRYLSADEEEQLRRALDKRESRLKAERASGNAWRRKRGYDVRAELWQQSFADHLKPMVLLTLNTGIRRGELFSLEWSMINLGKAFLTVHWSTAKNSKTRHIPLNREALTVLKKWRAQADRNGLVFPARDGRRFNHIKRSWTGVLEVAGISDFRWHDMRHHFASKLVMADVSLNVVRELLGHADIAMTLRYAHLSPEHKAEAVARLVG
jgi:integrase